jgi:hypothetical protein
LNQAFFYDLPEGKLGLHEYEENTLRYYDGNEMVPYCRFIFDGNVVKDYTGVYDNDVLISDGFVNCIWFHDNGRFIVSDWFSGVRNSKGKNQQFFTLYDRSDGSLQTAKQLKGSDSAKYILYKMQGWSGLYPINSNDPNVLVSLVRYEDLYDTDSDTENPVLQLLHLKRP